MMDEHEERVAKRMRHNSDDKYDIEEAFGAQEVGIARVDDNITFTAFNMDEELEEGHFDAEGTYIFRREKEELADWWIDNIDRSQLASVAEPTDERDDEQPPSNASELFKQIVRFMNPGETVTKAMQRLGKLSKSYKQKVKSKSNNDQVVNEESKNANEHLSELISLADRILQTGDTDVYEKTYEQIQFLNSASTSKEAD